MLRRILLILWFIGVSLLLMNNISNSGIPLGFDHGAYKHFVHLLTQTGNIEKIPVYLQQQFEPFSGTFFYTMFLGIPEKWLFSWGYTFLYIITSITLFILGKKSGKYTLGSYFGLFLFIFSALQYQNFCWSFGKQMFATFFLLLLMRYYRKPLIAIILLSACIALHRLTGSIAILFVLLLLLSGKKNNKGIMYLGLLIGFMSYLPTFSQQILPFFSEKIRNYIFIPGDYGTGLSGITFWSYQFPIIVLSYFSFKKSQKFRTIKKTDTHIFLLIFISLMVTFRCIAHTRLGTFLDLFLIIFITKNYISINRKILALFLIVQVSLWFSFAQRWHTSFIDDEEDTIIQTITKEIPNNVTLVTLTGAYMSMITGYMNNEIYSTYQGVGNTIFNKNELVQMRYNKTILCKNLSLLPNNVFIYVGAQESFTSTRKNSCLEEVKTWRNNSRLLHFRGYR